MIMGQFYLYRHVRLDTNTPFYIGIGTKKFKRYWTIRREYARAYAIGDKDRSIVWRRLYKKIGGNIDIEIMYESDSYEDVKSKECEFIKLYGRRDRGTGLLINLTDGGEGSPGTIVSIETREKLRESSKRGLQSLALTGRKLSDEHKEHIRQSLIGRIHSPEALKKQAAARRGKKMRPKTKEEKEKVGLFHKGRKRSERAFINMKAGWVKRKAKQYVGQLTIL